MGKKSHILVIHIIFHMFCSTLHLWPQQTVTSKFLRQIDTGMWIPNSMTWVSQLQLKFSLDSPQAQIFLHHYSLIDLCIHSNNTEYGTAASRQTLGTALPWRSTVQEAFGFFSLTAVSLTNRESNRFTVMLFIVPGLYRASGRVSQVYVEQKHSVHFWMLHNSAGFPSGNRIARYISETSACPGE